MVVQAQEAWHCHEIPGGGGGEPQLAITTEILAMSSTQLVFELCESFNLKEASSVRPEVVFEYTSYGAGGTESPR